MRKWTIAVDLMGAETPPCDIYEAVLCAMSTVSSSQIHTSFLTTENFVPLNGAFHDVIVCSQVVSPGDVPSEVIRNKIDSTLSVGVDLLAAKKIDAFISLGNTGALLTKTVITLPLCEGVERPALLTEITHQGRVSCVLDVGASVQIKASHLIQFAKLGVEYVKRTFHITHPKVALLNIGQEATKGGDEMKMTFQTLADNSGSDWTFLGNLEPNHFFESAADVVVTNGFSGNIFLKSIEGATSHIMKLMQQLDINNVFVSQLRRLVYDGHFFGGVIVGVNGLVVKCHGSSNKEQISKTVISVIQRLLQA